MLDRPVLLHRIAVSTCQDCPSSILTGFLDASMEAVARTECPQRVSKQGFIWTSSPRLGGWILTSWLGDLNL